MFIQLLGFIGFLFLISSFWLKKKRKILFLQIFAHIFYTVHYYYLNALSGTIISIVNIIRSAIFSYKDKYKILSSNITFILFVLVYTIIGILIYDGLISLLPILAVLIYTITSFYGNKKSIVQSFILCSLLWIVYNFYSKSYIGIFNETIMIISNLIVLKGDLSDTGCHK